MYKSGNSNITAYKIGRVVVRGNISEWNEVAIILGLFFSLSLFFLLLWALCFSPKRSFHSVLARSIIFKSVILADIVSKVAASSCSHVWFDGTTEGLGCVLLNGDTAYTWNSAQEYCHTEEEQTLSALTPPCTWCPSPSWPIAPPPVSGPQCHWSRGSKGSCPETQASQYLVQSTKFSELGFGILGIDFICLLKLFLLLLGCWNEQSINDI